MVKALVKNSKMNKRKGPVVLCIMDGMAYGKHKESDGWQQAMTNTLDRLLATCPNTKLKAHGFAVGMPSDSDMGNSEVGHNAIGAARVFSQGAKLVNESITSQAVFNGEVWGDLIANVKKNDTTLHLIGLLSDGNVHSHISHIQAMIERAKQDGAQKVRIHALIDGRDVGERSALEYVEPFELFLASLNDSTFDARIASGGGRMAITMDRYGADWPMVERGWQTHVLGQGRCFGNATEAINTYRSELDCIDQNLPPFVIAEDGQAIGTIEDNDSVVLCNFRGDRAQELSLAFDREDFDHFDRVRHPKVKYAGIMQYDGDLKIPYSFLVTPPKLDRTVPEYVAATGLNTYSISETQKFGHITYFFNGNRSEKFNTSLETYVEITSDNVSFDERPAMKCAEITDNVLEAMESEKFDFIKINYPNGDMVGHTGNLQAVVCSIEAMDLCLERLISQVKKQGGVLLVTADHGNADEMYEHAKDGSIKLNEKGEKVSKTAHSLNPVPFIIYDPENQGEYSNELKEGLGITSVGSTCISFLGYELPEGYDPSVITFK